MTHQPPAGWVYVAWHPKSPGFTKIGYSKAHPTDPDDRYTFKRVHQVGRHLVSFGFGPLECWSSPYHEAAKSIETTVHRELVAHNRRDVRPSTDIFDITPEAAIAIIEKHFNA